MRSKAQEWGWVLKPISGVIYTKSTVELLTKSSVQEWEPEIKAMFTDWKEDLPNASCWTTGRELVDAKRAFFDKNRGPKVLATNTDQATVFTPLKSFYYPVAVQDIGGPRAVVVSVNLLRHDLNVPLQLQSYYRTHYGIQDTQVFAPAHNLQKRFETHGIDKDFSAKEWETWFPVETSTLETSTTSVKDRIVVIDFDDIDAVFPFLEGLFSRGALGVVCNLTNDPRTQPLKVKITKWRRHLHKLGYELKVYGSLRYRAEFAVVGIFKL